PRLKLWRLRSSLNLVMFPCQNATFPKRGPGDPKLAEPRQPWLDLAPNPGGQPFKRRRLKSLDFVQEPVVELVLDVEQHGRKVAELHDQPIFRLWLAFQRHTHMKRMPVNPRVGMPLGRRRQEVGRLEIKLFIKAHV